MIETTELAPGLVIPRIVTGLWQVADMERDGRTLDPVAAAGAMAAYARDQAFCHLSEQLVRNLERHWNAKERKL